MRLKLLVFSLLALAVVVFVIASAVTVFALMGDSAAATETSVEVAPVLAEPVSQSEVVKPVLTYERVSHSEKAGGCPYKQVKTQLVKANTDKVDDQLLTQVQP